MRRPGRAAIVVLTLVAIGLGGLLLAVNHAIDRVVDSRRGPVHRFPIPAGETFLTTDRALAIAREVMNRDGLPESDWELLSGDDATAPDGRPHPSTTRSAANPHPGMVGFYCRTSPTPTRYVHVEWRDGEITAQGMFGK